MKITMVRHGQTTGNTGMIVESRIGGKLTEKGIDQAKNLAEKLKAEHFDEIYCSDMQRCIDTATLICEYHKEMSFFTRDDIREMHKGIYDGGSWDDLPDYTGTDTYITKQLEGGESWQDVEQRIRSFLNEIFNSNKTHVLVVTHDGVLKVMHTIFDEMPLTDAIKIYHDNANAYTWEMTVPVAESVK